MSNNRYIAQDSIGLWGLSGRGFTAICGRKVGNDAMVEASYGRVRHTLEGANEDDDPPYPHN